MKDLRCNKCNKVIAQLEIDSDSTRDIYIGCPDINCDGSYTE